MKRRLTASARRDVADILRWSLEHFGELARQRYKALILRGFDVITVDRDPLGATLAVDAPDGTRLYHLRHCRYDPRGASVRKPRHILLYRIEGERVVVMRVLHDAMYLPAHLDHD